MGKPEEIYTELTRLLGNRRDQIYDFEILPPGFGPLVHDGHSIGITKKAMVQAFCIARRVFLGALNVRQENSPTPKESKKTSSTGTRGDDAFGSISRAAEVILLFDPEHLTACNWKKRELIRILGQGLSDQIILAIRREITFTTTLLRSPLHRHSKSPTLWFHRYWIMSQVLLEPKTKSPKFLMTVLCSQDGETLACSALEDAEQVLSSELAVILESGEHHPMNYYAFSYIRQFIDLLARLLAQLPLDPSDNGLQPQQDQIFPSTHGRIMKSLSLRGVLQKTHTWCLSHPGDISGWSFLSFLLDKADDPSVRKSTVERTVQYATDIAWEGEALWSFLDNAVAKFDIPLDKSMAQFNAAEPSIGCEMACPKRWERMRSWAMSS